MFPPKRGRFRFTRKATPRQESPSARERRARLDIVDVRGEATKRQKTCALYSMPWHGGHHRRCRKYAGFLLRPALCNSFSSYLVAPTCLSPYKNTLERYHAVLCYFPCRPGFVAGKQTPKSPTFAWEDRSGSTPRPPRQNYKNAQLPTCDQEVMPQDVISKTRRRSQAPLQAQIASTSRE